MSAPIVLRMIFIVSVFSGVKAQAEAPSSKISSQVTSESGGTVNSSNVKSQTLSLDISTGSALKRKTLRLGFDNLNADYSNFLITQKDGSSSALSESFNSPQYSVRTGVDLFLGSSQLSFDASKMVSDSPFAGSTAKMAAVLPIFERGAKFGVSISHFSRRAPASYFIDPDSLRAQLRPTLERENRIQVLWEQILSENMKSQLSTFTAERPEWRPAIAGAEFALGYALTAHVALHGKVGAITESRRSAHFDERGYFDTTWAQLELRSEPNYRWTLSGLLGTTLEVESERAVAPEQRIGTDTVGVQLRTKQKDYEFGLRALQSFSNTNYRSSIIGGELLWNI